MRFTLPRKLAIALVAAIGLVHAVRAGDEPLRIATFQADITPPLGSPLGFGYYQPAEKIDDPLSARGIVLFGEQEPVVLCAVDWILLENGGHAAFRDALAAAAGTSADRVCIHCLHQHDAPGVDFTAEELLAAQGVSGAMFDVAYARRAIEQTAAALATAVRQPQTVTHLGIGKAKVEQVASNRRILGPDGKIKSTRWSATTDPAVRAEPEGLIDPDVRLLSFWDGERAIASLTYYATHPQSYYNQGGVTCDFPGLARGLREVEWPGVAHIHFNGASGNITAGKYNDGAQANRPVLAGRLAAGMKSAWEAAANRKVPLRAADLEWRVKPVLMPVHANADAAKLQAMIGDSTANVKTRLSAARELAWLQRCQAGDTTDLICLRIGPAYVVHMPGELFIEYQLAAQAMLPDATVCMAAYGDCAAGYIGTAAAYAEGGYEPSASLVAPEVEKVLMDGLRELLLSPAAAENKSPSN